MTKSAQTLFREALDPRYDRCDEGHLWHLFVVEDYPLEDW